LRLGLLHNYEITSLIVAILSGEFTLS